MRRIMIVFFLGLVVLISGSFLPKNDLATYDQAIAGSVLTIKMMPIKGGQFLAGSPKNEIGRTYDEGPTHLVDVSDFWMSSLEISWELFELFLYRQIDKEATISKGSVSLDVDGVSAATMPYVNFNRPGHPVVNLTEYAASGFCKWLTAKTGHFYRLPTEAEWEYACRAGSTTAYSFGENANDLGWYAFHKSNSANSFRPSGLKKPNSWGLYDMHGNVAEWVIDQYDAGYYKTLASGEKDPVKFSKSLYPRVVRGGSWNDSPSKLRSAARSYSTSKWKMRDPQFPKSLWWMTDATHVGFRIVRPKKEHTLEEMEAYWGEAIEEY